MQFFVKNNDFVTVKNHAYSKILLIALAHFVGENPFFIV